MSERCISWGDPKLWPPDFNSLDLPRVRKLVRGGHSVGPQQGGNSVNPLQGGNSVNPLPGGN